MQSQWPKGHAWAFTAGVGMLLLGLSLAQPPPSSELCPTGEAPSPLTQPAYQGGSELDPGAGFMKILVQSFLNTVQPKPFPADLITRIIEEVSSIQSFPGNIVREILIYEIGFLVCIAIGIVYIVLVPVVGLLMACCRCCGNCGGTMYQKQTSNINCRRRALYWSAFLTTIIILAGNVCMFLSNEATRVSVEQSAQEVGSSFDNIRLYLNSVPQEIDRVVQESHKTVNEVTRSLNSIGPLLGTEIQTGLNGTLDPALDSVRLMAQEAVTTEANVKELNSSLAQLQASSDLLQANISGVKDRINRTILSPACTGCSVANSELDKLTLDTNIRTPSLTEFQSALDEVIRADLNSKVQEGKDFFDSIPQRVTNDTKDVVQSAKLQLEEISQQISQISSDIPLSGLDDIAGNVTELENYIDSIRPDLDHYEYIRWAVGVAVCCVVLLVLVCNSLGLLFGPAGLKPHADPTQRSCAADCGGTFLMMGAGFSFLFGWLLMILVVILFILGGNAYTLVCHPWDNGDLLKFLDTPDVIPGFDLDELLGLNSDLKISNVYRDCSENKALWTTLHLYELINLDDLLNVTKYTEDIQQHFENTNITLSTITILTPEVVSQLTSFSGNAKDIDFTTVTQQINNITAINLNLTADRINQLADLQINAPIQTELREEARDLRRIQADIETTIYPQLDTINSTIGRLRSTAQKINKTVENVLKKVGTAQDFLNTNTTKIIKAESQKFLDCQMGYFIAFTDWANVTIREQVGRCGPVAGAVDSVDRVVCLQLVEALNAFWFSLGWCLLFFIPSIIFTIKLAKYYRRMEQSDVYEDNPHIAMNHIPRAQMKAY